MQRGQPCLAVRCNRQGLVAGAGVLGLEVWEEEEEEEEEEGEEVAGINRLLPVRAGVRAGDTMC